jgi:hypothetical protein
MRAKGRVKFPPQWPRILEVVAMGGARAKSVYYQQRALGTLLSALANILRHRITFFLTSTHDTVSVYGNGGAITFVKVACFCV